MIISHKHKYLFISNPKTGTHTMYHYLPERYNGERFMGFHEREVPEEYKDYFIFTTFRNPLERFVAAWNSLLFQPDYRPIYLEKIGSDSFGAFIDYITSFNNQTVFTGKGSPVLCLQTVWLRECIGDIDYFMRTEHMELDFANLPFTSGEDEIEAKLKRDHVPFAEMIPEITKDQLLNLYNWLEPDINKYFEILDRGYLKRDEDSMRLQDWWRF